MLFRTAVNTDIPDVAAPHADSWRRFYRGAESDEYLDGAMPPKRLTAWSLRFTAPDPGT
ncbi:hypothetical protein Ais01nite_61230 [Asanoa ishikariensis]|uniref:GNAT family N-acetyltransferase n=1 Tax=Asanoa ishikariensis TaxID=137265 RepID=A0A1H3P5P7_9ACTN|nr:hypothetical protein [Asanoa ishikariensis]GIF68088.1 hypothetical protein Ais01nite_61230 [Asanoa ishikariensis]SDY96432.1 hypothetical protein SAMN05421684_2604 [Asanoa ishikariensis]